MERAIAVKKLVKLLGKKVGYRIDSKAPTSEERAAAKAALPQAVAERDKIKAKCEERYRAILAADAEYQSLLAARKAAQAKTDGLFGISQHYKITVGLDEGFFFLVKASGDSWEDVIEKLTAKERPIPTLLERKRKALDAINEFVASETE